MHPLELLRRLFHSPKGASSVEYAILIGGIAALLVATVALLGQTLSGLYSRFVLH